MDDRPAQKYIQAEIRPPAPASVDWQHRPSQFKLYQYCTRIPLPYSSTQTHHDGSATQFTLGHIGELLAKSYGLLQQYYTIPLSATSTTIPQELSTIHLRRPVPSGGALFPCEMYLFSGAGQHLPAGIYHYDVAHHALDILQPHNSIEAVCSCLAHASAIQPAYILALSCFFWKDGFKYGEFSYRLQGLDLGTVIAQCIAILNQQTIAATVHYQFFDTNIDALLALDSQQESVYALITLDTGAAEEATPTASEAIPTLPTHCLSQELPSVACWPLVEAIHQASFTTTCEQFRSLRCLPAITPPPAITSYTLPTIDKEPVLLTGYQQRHSTQGRFVPTPMTMHQLAHFCQFSMTGYENDLDGSAQFVQQTVLYCVVNRVKGLPQGVYFYNPHSHTLEMVVPGDMRAELQAAQLGPALNVYDVSVCFFPVGDYAAGFHQYGDRWYRIQHMEAGMIVQRLYLTAASHLGCRAFLSFSQRSVRTLLHLPEHQYVLIEIMVAPETTPYGYYELPVYP